MILDHEHIFEQAEQRFVEACTIGGCTAARISRRWLARLQPQKRVSCERCVRGDGCAEGACKYGLL